MRIGSEKLTFLPDFKCRSEGLRFRAERRSRRKQTKTAFRSVHSKRLSGQAGARNKGARCALIFDLVAPPVGPFGYIVACHHLALPFNMLCSPVQALPALIRFALQTCAPILLSQTGPLGQQGEPQKKERTSVLSFFLWLPLLDSNQRPSG